MGLTDSEYILYLLALSMADDDERKALYHMMANTSDERVRRALEEAMRKM